MNCHTYQSVCSSLIVSELVPFFQCFQTLLLAFLEGRDNPLAEHGFTTFSDRRPSSQLFMAFSPKSNAAVLTIAIVLKVLTPSSMAPCYLS